MITYNLDTRYSNPISLITLITCCVSVSVYHQSYVVSRFQYITNHMLCLGVSISPTICCVTVSVYHQPYVVSRCQYITNHMLCHGVSISTIICCITVSLTWLRIRKSPRRLNSDGSCQLTQNRYCGLSMLLRNQERHKVIRLVFNLQLMLLRLIRCRA